MNLSSLINRESTVSAAPQDLNNLSRYGRILFDDVVIDEVNLIKTFCSYLRSEHYRIRASKKQDSLIASRLAQRYLQQINVILPPGISPAGSDDEILDVRERGVLNETEKSRFIDKLEKRLLFYCGCNVQPFYDLLSLKKHLLGT